MNAVNEILSIGIVQQNLKKEISANELAANGVKISIRSNLMIDGGEKLSCQGDGKDNNNAI